MGCEWVTWNGYEYILEKNKMVPHNIVCCPRASEITHEPPSLFQRQVISLAVTSFFFSTLFHSPCGIQGKCTVK